MNKLFVFDDGRSDYTPELAAAFAEHEAAGPVYRVDLGNLDVDFLTRNDIQVIVSNGLPDKWADLARQHAIVTVAVGAVSENRHSADIVVDHLSSDRRRYFTGPEFSVLGNPNFRLTEVTDLVSMLEWDTGFFGFPVAYVSCRYLTETIVTQTNRFIAANGVRLVEYLCNCHDDRSVLLAEREKYHFTDIRLSFDLRLKGKVDVDPGSFTFGAAGPADIQRLRVLAQSIYADSRYFYDGNFEPAKIQEFYAGWVEKAVHGTFDHVCFCLFADGAPVAFCSVRYGDAGSAAIGLFGTDPSFSGKGLGRKLLIRVLNELVDRGFTAVTVVTQGRNYAAQRLYQSVGFRTLSTQLWYHKWI